MEVIYGELRITPQQVVKMFVREEVDVVGISTFYGVSMAVIPEILHAPTEYFQPTFVPFPPTVVSARFPLRRMIRKGAASSGERCRFFFSPRPSSAFSLAGYVCG